MGITALTGGLVKGFAEIKDSINLAGNALEMESKFDIVFGELNKQADDWAENFVDKVGGSVYTVKDMMASTQDLLTGFGASRKRSI
jgi:hypothetical protein